MTAAWLFVAGLPRWAKLALIVTGGITAFWVWDYFDDSAAIEADRGASAAKAQKAARRADEAATAETEEVRNEVERENAAAQSAAAGGDDLLGDGLRSLRASH